MIINYEGTLAEKQPVKGEEVILGTRVRAYNRFFVIRDFWVKDLAGNYYAKVSGTFVFMNLAKRKIMTIPQEMIDTFQMDETKRLPRLENPACQKTKPAGRNGTTVFVTLTSMVTNTSITPTTLSG